MNIDGVTTGIVLDHIQAGNSMRIYGYLGLDQLDCVVAVIQNAESRKYGNKDIIMIDAPIEMNLDVLGYLDPRATVNRIQDGVLIEKEHLAPPRMLTDVISCKNPRCITSVEPAIDQVFELEIGSHAVYRCVYCDAEAKER